MSNILKIYNTSLCKLNILKDSSLGISISTTRVTPAYLNTLMERDYQVAGKEKDDLNKQEEDIFDDGEDDTITVWDKDFQNSLLRFVSK